MHEDRIFYHLESKESVDRKLLIISVQLPPPPFFFLPKKPPNLSKALLAHTVPQKISAEAVETVSLYMMDLEARLRRTSRPFACNGAAMAQAKAAPINIKPLEFFELRLPKKSSKDSLYTRHRQLGAEFQHVLDHLYMFDLAAHGCYGYPWGGRSYCWEYVTAIKYPPVGIQYFRGYI